MYRTSPDNKQLIRIMYLPRTRSQIIGYATFMVLGIACVIAAGQSRTPLGAAIMIAIALISAYRAIREFSAVIVVVDHSRGVVKVLSAFTPRVEVPLATVTGADLETAAKHVGRIRLLLKNGKTVPLDSRLRAGLPHHENALARLQHALEPPRPGE